jgi:hypothetical protein
MFDIGSTSTVMEYLSYLEYSWLLHFVPKFSHSLKKQMMNDPVMGYLTNFTSNPLRKVLCTSATRSVPNPEGLAGMTRFLAASFVCTTTS